MPSAIHGRTDSCVSSSDEHHFARKIRDIVSCKLGFRWPGFRNHVDNVAECHDVDTSSKLPGEVEGLLRESAL
jgi:hypothetical protein